MFLLSMCTLKSFESAHVIYFMHCRIIVEDTNENAPQFDMNGYSAQIGEELPAGQVVTQVS